MGDQKTQRLDLATQAAQACKDLINALHALSELTERKPYLGAFADADFTRTDLVYLDAAVVNLLFDRVAPAMVAAYNHQAFNDADGFQLVVSGNAGRNRQILNQIAKNIS